MKLTYLDDYHYFDASSISPAPRIIHVGIKGLVALKKARELFPQAKLEGYEPDPKNFNGVVNTAKDLNVKMTQKALGDCLGHVTLYRYTNEVSHSCFPRHEKDPNCVLVGSVKVPVTVLSYIVQGTAVDLLILNCEGGELYAMRDLIKSPALRGLVKQICVSFHSPRIYPQAKRDKCVDKLRQYYEIVVDPHPAGIPDHLFVRKF